KSHTLAAFGALAALPDIRSTVGDAHVATSARRLLNRRYTVARVERGTRQTLLEEVRAAFAAAFGNDEAEWTGEPAQMLAIAASRLTDTPLVLIIDTAFGREARVKRDDGPVLSELAAATAQANAFVALALDDDIQGADGANVALAGTYQIDYLDPEHLYRIADVHLFQKNAQARAALHDIYTSLRTSVPGFNWSEPRFASVYPVHPLVADVAAAVRLYAPGFAFLPFAAAASLRAVNRPAASLIALDEVFDRAEYDMRKAEELKDAFVVYDQLATETVTQFPIMQRLQAKLILKGLFILSLDGRGASASDLGAAMLIYDEAQPAASVERIEGILARFNEAAPDALRRSEDGGEARYCFSIGASAAFEAALDAAAGEIADDDPAIGELLRTVARARFEDWPFAETETGEREALSADFIIMWRGMGRRGRLTWQAFNDRLNPPASNIDATLYDWEIVILTPGLLRDEPSAQPSLEHLVDSVRADAPRFAAWRPAAMTIEESKNLRRLVALRAADASLAAEFGDTARVTERTHAALAERIWTRSYMDDGVLLMGGHPRSFTEDARAAQTLAEALARVLAPLLGAHFPQHPVFTETLGESEVARLVGGLFGGANQSDQGVQELARLFAEPLGLASLRGDLYALEAGDQALKQPWVREVLALTDEADGEVVPFDVVYEKLRREPYGLLREVQYLILAALVAQRRIELVTSNGDRIGRRTLDLKLRWEEIAGVARAATLLHGAEELTAWARRLTDNTHLQSIADPAARSLVRTTLSSWLTAWRDERLLENFDALPDEGLTTRAWNLASAVRKSFGGAAEAVEAALADAISLEEGLQRVADAFGDSEEQFARSREQRAALTSFVEGLTGREQARAYLASAEPTTIDEIESARRELLAIADDAHNLFDPDSNKRFDLLWRAFHARYSEHYAALHDETVGPASDRRTIDALLRSDEWRDFEMLSRLAVVNRKYWDEAVRLRGQSENVHCELPVKQILVKRPACE
ncbi:MAG: hypothetical protein WCF57_22830, partial [Pyrinomonadaceae bacterium]